MLAGCEWKLAPADVLQIVFGNNATVDSILSEIRSGVQTLYEAGARK